MSTFTLALLGALTYLGWRHYRIARELTLARQNAVDEPHAGHYVEVDCASCGKMNRIPSQRLRSRPLCGSCRARLLPKRQIVITHVRNLDFDPALRRELDAVWSDYDRFWFTLDAHVRPRGPSSTVDAKDRPN